MSDNAPASGLWSLVIVNSLVFVIFAFSFAKPQSPRDWRSSGAFSAFTLVKFPILVTMDVQLANGEEAYAERHFGQAWRDYAATTPRFLPHVGILRTHLSA